MVHNDALSRLTIRCTEVDSSFEVQVEVRALGPREHTAVPDAADTGGEVTGYADDADFTDNRERRGPGLTAIATVDTGAPANTWHVAV